MQGEFGLRRRGSRNLALTLLAKHRIWGVVPEGQRRANAARYDDQPEDSAFPTNHVAAPDSVSPIDKYRDGRGGVYRGTASVPPDLRRVAGYESGFTDYAEADTLPAAALAFPAVLFWFAEVIQSKTGDATKIEL